MVKVVIRRMGLKMKYEQMLPVTSSPRLKGSRYTEAGQLERTRAFIEPGNGSIDGSGSWRYELTRGLTGQSSP